MLLRGGFVTLSFTPTVYRCNEHHGSAIARCAECIEYFRGGEAEAEKAGVTMPPNRKRLYLIIATLGLLGLAAMVALLVCVLL